MEKDAVLQALAALSQGSRLDIFRHLVSLGPGGSPAGRIGESLGLPSATLSFHLKELKAAGLLVARREGRRIIYAADFDAMNALLAYLAENCCQGSDETCAPAPCVADEPQPAPALRRRSSGR